MNEILLLTIIFISLFTLCFGPSIFTFVRRSRAYKHIKLGFHYVVDVKTKNPFDKNTQIIYEIVDVKDGWIRFHTPQDDRFYEWDWDEFILYHRYGKKVADLVIKQRKHEKNISKSN